MCNEYDEERMRAFWRAIAANEGLKVLSIADAEPEPVVEPMGPASVDPAKPKPRALVR